MQNKLLLFICLISVMLFTNKFFSQNLCHEGSGGGPCFNAEIVEKTKELKLNSENEKSVLFKFISKTKTGENIYSDGKNKVIAYIDTEISMIISVKLLTNINFGDAIYEKGLYSEPAD